jgi:hypothetical protein
MSSIVVQSPPAAEPLSLETVKLHLKVDIPNEDSLISVYMQSARELIESQSGRSLINKVYRQSHDTFPHRHEGSGFGAAGFFYNAPRYAQRRGDEHLAIKLLRCPLVAVQRISYRGVDGLSHDLLPAPESWQADSEYTLGAQIVDSNGDLEEVTDFAGSPPKTAGSSGPSVPAWGAGSPPTITSDGDLIWTNKGLAPAGDFLVDRDSEPPRLLPLWGQVWPATLRVPDAVRIFFLSGYGAAATNAPAALKVALMMIVGVSHEQREAACIDDVRDLNWFDRMIWSQRVTDFAPTP